MLCNVILGTESMPSLEPVSSKKSRGSSQAQEMEPLNLEHEKHKLPSGNLPQNETIQPARDHAQTPTQNSGSEAKQVKGALPEGFFDNKEADLRARGIKPIKPDVKYISTLLLFLHFHVLYFYRVSG